MKNVILALGLILFLAGCAATKQAISDFKTGQGTPLVNGEVSPSQQAQVVQNAVQSLPIPISGPIGAGVGFLAMIFFTWRRGVSIRNNGGAPTVTQAQGSAITNGILQDVANIFSGMFTTAVNASKTTVGSTLQRVWKVALATAASGTALAVSNTDVAAFLGSHPYLDLAFVAISSGLAGLEKAVSSVPVTTTTASQA